MVAWNKGLTKETDDRVKKYAISGALTRKGKCFVSLNGRKKLSLSAKAYNLGKINRPVYTSEVRKKMSLVALGHSCPEETRRKIGLAQIGEKNHLWLGGKSFEPYSLDFNKQFKNLIRQRDNQVCMNCNIHREKISYALCVHHINYDKQLSILENCISLCRKCHSLTNINRLYWTKLFQDKLNKLYDYQYLNNAVCIKI